MTTQRDTYWDMTNPDTTPSILTTPKISSEDLQEKARSVLAMAEQISSDVDTLAAGHRRLMHVAIAAQRVLEARARQGLPIDVEPYNDLIRALENV